MLTNVLRAFISEPFREIFYGKREKTINILTTFLIFYKSDIKPS